MEHLLGHVRSNAEFVSKHVVPFSHTGKSVTICGAGPSLNDHLPELCDTDETWGCNGALTYLYEKNVRVTHGFCIDQGEAMLSEKEWGTRIDLPRYVASSIHPRLTKFLAQTIGQESLIWFHNFLGIESDGLERELYRTLYPKTIVAGHGLNSATRAVCLALGMGFSDIRVFGSDSAARPDSPDMPELGTPEYREWMGALVLYADGRTAGESFGNESPMTEAPDIDGRRWVTRPDMVISALHLIQLTKAYPGITVHGDNMVTAMMKQPPEWFTDLPILRNDGVIEGFGNKQLEVA